MNTKTDKNFKALQDKWYKKLEEEGFEDIEKTNGTLLRVDLPDNIQKFYTRDVYDLKEYYYRCATHFVHSHEFINEVEKAIWELHSDGLSIRNITKKLHSQQVFKSGKKTVNKRYVHETINILAKEMLRQARNDDERFDND